MQDIDFFSKTVLDIKEDDDDNLINLIETPELLDGDDFIDYYISDSDSKNNTVATAKVEQKNNSEIASKNKSSSDWLVFLENTIVILNEEKDDSLFNIDNDIVTLSYYITLLESLAQHVKADEYAHPTNPQYLFYAAEKVHSNTTSPDNKDSLKSYEDLEKICCLAQASKHVSLFPVYPVKAQEIQNAGNSMMDEIKRYNMAHPS